NSIEAVVRRYTSTVYGVALTHTGNRSDADDVFQEVFLAYHRSNPALTSEEHRKAWLIRTTLNLSLKVTQGSWRQKVVPFATLRETGPASKHEPFDLAAAPPLGGSASETTARPADFAFETTTQDLVFDALHGLPETYRSVLHLFYFDDLPVKAIAALLDLEPGAVKTRLSRGRDLMREKLKGVFNHA
ncbi:MAG: sigma-70 family RNA polymerase sigma factor, partial [Coriobacteriales bacterium]|nr:sigma-70 family RNA polymerase sigma factor [Coriobacteriales bacterium]